MTWRARQNPRPPKMVTALAHPEAKHDNIPTAEYQSVMQAEDKAPGKVDLAPGFRTLG